MEAFFREKRVFWATFWWSHWPSMGSLSEIFSALAHNTEVSCGFRISAFDASLHCPVWSSNRIAEQEPSKCYHEWQNAQVLIATECAMAGWERQDHWPKQEKCFPMGTDRIAWTFRAEDNVFKYQPCPSLCNSDFFFFFSSSTLHHKDKARKATNCR